MLSVQFHRGGGAGALEAGEGQDTGEASRAGLEIREAWADPGTRKAMAEQETREAMVDPGTREAMADQETREVMADQET